MYLEVFVTAPIPGGGDGTGVWTMLKKWAVEADGAGRLHTLLRRYCQVSLGSSGELIERLCHSAEAAALELLGSILRGASSSAGNLNRNSEPRS